MSNPTPQQTYEQERQRHLVELSIHRRRRSRLGWLRFIVFIATIAVSWFVFIHHGAFGFLPLIIGIAVLLFLVSQDVNNNQRIRNSEALVLLNEEELKLLQYDYYHRPDGSRFLPPLHDYAHDLDLFGKASLFQWINRCHSEEGMKLLAQRLLAPLTPEEVLQRQSATAELAPLVGWRQQFEAHSKKDPLRTQTQNRVSEWIAEKSVQFLSTPWKLVLLVFPLLMIALAFSAAVGWIPVTLFSAGYTLALILSLGLGRRAAAAYSHLSGIVKEISAFQKLIGWIESREFHDTYLQQLSQSIRTGENKASVELKKLQGILDRFDQRLNLAGLLFLNPFLLWDVRQVRALNEWKEKNREALPQWFAVIAEMEVLHTLANLRFNQPSWCLPKLVEPHFRFEAAGLGHPLLPGNVRVCSDFSLEGQGKIALITGSNMAGKSTFLRSLGLNTVLAQTGAVTCATVFQVSPVRLMSSMRIADNLAENTSTFYAELKKLKTIIEAVNRNEKVFILLDEILRGTNSLDRHTGSAALMRQLIRQRAVAVIATHDVELAALKDVDASAVDNYHFDVQVSGEELYFDYLLKQGVCTNLNASLLMKKIGIEMGGEAG